MNNAIAGVAASDRPDWSEQTRRPRVEGADLSSDESSRSSPRPIVATTDGSYDDRHVIVAALNAGAQGSRSIVSVADPEIDRLDDPLVTVPRPPEYVPRVGTGHSPTAIAKGFGVRNDRDRSGGVCSLVRCVSR